MVVVVPVAALPVLKAVVAAVAVDKVVALAVKAVVDAVANALSLSSNKPFKAKAECGETLRRPA